MYQYIRIMITCHLNGLSYLFAQFGLSLIEIDIESNNCMDQHVCAIGTRKNMTMNVHLTKGSVVGA